MNPPKHPNVPHMAERIKFQDVMHSSMQGFPVARQEVIDTQEEYDAWIAASFVNKEAYPQDIDFTKEMIVAVSLGEKPTSGYDIRIETIGEIVGGVVGIQWQVFYRATSPARGEMTLQVLTSPQHLVRTPRFGGIVTFRPIEELSKGLEKAPGRAKHDGKEKDPYPMTTMAAGEDTHNKGNHQPLGSY